MLLHTDCRSRNAIDGQWNFKSNEWRGANDNYIHPMSELMTKLMPLLIRVAVVPVLLLLSHTVRSGNCERTEQKKKLDKKL